MKNLSIILFVAILCVHPKLSLSEDTDLMKTPKRIDNNFNVSDLYGGSFCNLESLSVCVITNSNEDCLKLGGQTVMSCANITRSAKHSGHDDNSCMSNEEAQEPVSCYGF